MTTNEYHRLVELQTEVQRLRGELDAMTRERDSIRTERDTLRLRIATIEWLNDMFAKVSG